VILPKRIAIEIAKDLERLDACDSMSVLQVERIGILESQVTIQKGIALDRLEQIGNLQNIVDHNAEIITLGSEEVELWKKQYRKQKRQKFLVGGIGLGLIAILVIAN
jgi:hypothetical protein